MNLSPEKEPINPWKNRSDFANIGKKPILFSILIVFLCAALLPLSFFYEQVALIGLAVLFAYVALIVRSPLPVTLLLVTAFLAVSFTSFFAAGAFLLALIVGSGAMAFLFTVLEHAYLLLLAPVAASGLAFALLGNWQISLLAFAFLPTALFLALATKWGRGRTSAICYAEVGLLLVVVGVAVYWLHTESTRLGVGIASYIESLREMLLQAVVQIRDTFAQMMRENGASEEELNTILSQLSNDYIKAQISQIFNLLPAICCVFCGIVAFEAQMLLNATYRAVGWTQVLTPEARVFTMSVPAALIYFVTFLLSIFSSSGTSIAWAVIDNLNLILVPGFCVIGVTMLALSLARSKGGARLFLTFLLAAVFCCYTVGAFSLLALFGANSILLGALRKKMMDKMNENGDNEPKL